jgi:transposase InsO family protein
MPWREVSIMGERLEFVRLASKEGVNRRELCRRFGISPEVGYKWLARFAAGDVDLADRSRRPHTAPLKVSEEIEADVLAVRDAHPAWGARKIARVMERQGSKPPAVSTVHAILVRNDRIVPPAGGPRAWQRFAKEAPNQLWQMDFKGWVKTADGVPCHPLTMIDDHSRFALCLAACANQQGATVRSHLERTFHRYGLPAAFFVDNGTPWGDPSGTRWTRLGVWLLKLGIDVVHSRPYHPQSRGKNERFHRTLAAEVFAFARLADLAAAQRAFNQWRDVYNLERPHEALGQEVPASRYRPSVRAMPARLPEVEYDEGEIVRIVPTTKAYIRFKGRWWKVPQAFRGERVAVRPIADRCFGIFFASHQIATIDLTKAQSVSDVSEQALVISPG